jgi:Skp family chaperone for outer membrane proteins
MEDLVTSIRPVFTAIALLLAAVPAAMAQPAPTAPAPASPAPPQAPLTFPADARIGFVDLNRVASASKQGQSLTTKMEDARVRKEQEVAARSKEVAALETKLAGGGGVLNETARAQLQRELERAFLAKASPAIAAVARERALWAVFSVDEATLLWREPSLDLSEEIARRIDAAP